jgi:hypothetical protein
MAGRTCHNCVYSCHDPEQWLRHLAAGAPLLPQCANHPQWPGRLHEVPGVPCRNYRPRPATPAGEVRMIPLGDGCYAYVDAADYEWLSRYHWRLCGAYAGRYENGQTILMHREIMRPAKGMVVDHVDGNKANNCRSNLRVCTRLENQRNKRKNTNSSSRFKGVYWDKRYGKWYARCRYKGVNYGLGCYGDDEVAAARAYDRRAVEWFGPYARPNFPEEWPPERRAELYAQRQEPPGREKTRAASKKARSKKTPPRAGTRRRREQKRKTPAAKRRTKRKAEG